MNTSGDQVLVRATVSADGRTVMVAPGVEIAMASVDVVAEMPPAAAGWPIGIILMFESHGDLREFVRTYQAEEL